MNTRERVMEHLEYVTETLGYNRDRILGIFLYGSQNYDLATKDSDVDTKVIILPSFSDMCLKKEWLFKEYVLDNGEHIVVKDIRDYAKNLFKQNINFVELLFTDYKWVNPRYEELFNSYFISNREEIARIDAAATVKSIAHQALHTLNQDSTDKKKQANTTRLNFFLDNYIAHKSYLDCLIPKGQLHDNLLSLKTKGVSKLNDAELDRLKENLEWHIKNAEVLDEKSLTGAAAVNNGVIEILKYSFAEPEQEEISYKDFLDKLTHAEERAFKAIVNNIGIEGNITISKLVAETSISRPVYNNLLNKLKESNIATIVNMGMKGTYINITHTLIKAKILEGEL